MKRCPFILPILITLFHANLCSSQVCDSLEAEVVIQFTTDNFGFDFGLALVDVDKEDTIINYLFTEFQSNSTYFINECINLNTCHKIILTDTYGDGFQMEGNIEITFQDQVIFEDENFGDFHEVYFNCLEGSYCEKSKEISIGNYVQNIVNGWYLFKPTKIGRYKISTCNIDSTCNTTLWIYEECSPEQTNSEEGYIFYNDKNEACGGRANISAPLDPNKEYIIRLKNDLSFCSSVDFELSYLGSIVGCMDSKACNFNPLATEDDGSCIDWTDPKCHDGPDLAINRDVIGNSIRVDSIENLDDCFINEQCLNGYGMREILRFTTHIANVGNLDYFVGNQVDNPEQFEVDECHGHNHILNYAQYIFYDQSGKEIPIGSKQGFCFTDSNCPSDDMYKFSCLEQGISPGCYDIYDAALNCQWLDITDVPDGKYIFVAIVNPTFRRDAVGRAEKDSLNNRAQLCLELTRKNGSPEVIVDWDCEEYVDCNGIINGSTQIDCLGICNGMNLSGDINEDRIIDQNDIDKYLTSILTNDTYTDCTDLFVNKNIDIYDAYLLNSCLLYGETHIHESDFTEHSHCQFPSGIYNSRDSMHLELIQGLNENYVDVFISNPSDGLKAFEFQFQGIEIESIIEMNDNPDQVFDIRFNPGTGIIAALSIEENHIPRSNDPQHLVRIHFGNHDGELCLDPLNSYLVSTNEELVALSVLESCIPIVISNTYNLDAEANVIIIPNPTKNSIQFSESIKGVYNQYSIIDINGKLIRLDQQLHYSESISVQSLLSGMYILQLKGKESSLLMKFVKE